MGITWLKNIGTEIAKIQNSGFTYPVDKQKAYIAHFPEPKDGIERGYFQYCCRMKLYGGFLHGLMNLTALPVSVFYLLKYRRKHAVVSDCKKECVFISYGIPENVVPDSLHQRYPDMLSVKTLGHRLSREDVAFLKAIFKRYPFSWMLWLKVIIKVAQYSYVIAKHAPQAIISCSEYAYTAPILTEYCHSHDVKHINVMHGEKIYYMRDSFVNYDEFYAWDQHYVDLLTDLRAKKEQFRIELPASMQIKKQDDISIQYDYTYYLLGESKEIVQTIANTMRVLHDQGKRISIRPHPRYSDVKMVAELFDFANIEDCKAVTIEHSLLQTGAAVALFSTVLNQAVNSSIPIVIDDISDRKCFDQLKELRYICLHKEHTLLSEIAGEPQ